MKTFILILSVLWLTGCTDAERAKVFSAGSKHKIQLYSGTNCVGTWESTGQIMDVEKGDGCYFMDEATHKLVTIRGTMIITQE